MNDFCDFSPPKIGRFQQFLTTECRLIIAVPNLQRWAEKCNVELPKIGRLHTTLLVDFRLKIFIFFNACIFPWKSTAPAIWKPAENGPMVDSITNARCSSYNSAADYITAPSYITAADYSPSLLRGIIESKGHSKKFRPEFSSFIISAASSSCGSVLRKGPGFSPTAYRTRPFQPWPWVPLWNDTHFPGDAWPRLEWDVQCRIPDSSTARTSCRVESEWTVRRNFKILWRPHWRGRRQHPEHHLQQKLALPFLVVSGAIGHRGQMLPKRKKRRVSRCSVCHGGLSLLHGWRGPGHVVLRRGQIDYLHEVRQLQFCGRTAGFSLWSGVRLWEYLLSVLLHARQKGIYHPLWKHKWDFSLSP